MITIPSKVARQLNINKGDILEAHAEDDLLVFKKMLLVPEKGVRKLETGKE